MQLRWSEAGRWVPCPASRRLQAPIPDVPSPDAEEGTAAHWVAAQVLGGHHEAEELTDRQAPNGIMVTADMLENLELYFNTVHPLPVVEQTIATGVGGVDDGTPDACRVDGAFGHIWDLKYGWAIVEAPGNWQGAGYIVSLFAKHQWTLDAITFHIVQPRPYHHDGRVRSWKVTRAEAIHLHEQLTIAVERTQDPNAPAITGPHCRDCRALHVCEAARRAGLNGVDIAYTGQSVYIDGAPLGSELSTLRRAADVIKLRLDALESHAMTLIDSGKIVPGWSTERAWGNRRWKRPGDVTALEAISGTTLTETKPVTPKQAEKRGVDKMLVKQFTTTPETGRKLVERDGSTKAREVFGSNQGDTRK